MCHTLCKAPETSQYTWQLLPSRSSRDCRPANQKSECGIKCYSDAMDILLGILKPEWLEFHCVVPSQDIHSCGHSLAIVILSIKFHYPKSMHCPPEIIFSLSTSPSLVPTSSPVLSLPQHRLPELSTYHCLLMIPTLIAFMSPVLMCVRKPQACVIQLLALSLLVLS